MPAILVPAGNPSPWTGPTGNNTFLLPGREPALVDAGVGDAGHLSAIAALTGGAPLATVFLTHGHPDHAGGLPALVNRWPSVRIVRFPGVRDGSPEIPAGDGSLQILHTPGHSPDHLCFFDRVTGDLYCGDLVRSGGTVVLPASRGGNLRDYLQSLRRILALGPRRLMPGHGAIIEDPEAVIASYLRHREQRDAQVIDALRSGLGTPEQIAARIYVGLATALLPAAADTVLAHLVKLEEEGRVASAGGRWRSLQAG